MAGRWWPSASVGPGVGEATRGPVRHSGGAWRCEPSEAAPSPRPTEDTITKRALVTIPGIALALALAACGSSDEEESAGGSSAASESASPTPAEATGADYAALFTALSQQQGKVQRPTSAKQFNEQADFPEGVSVGAFDPKVQSLCVQDATKDISGTFTSTGDVGISLSDGVCGKGEEVSKLVPDPKNPGKILVEGDQEIGQPVVEVFAQQPTS